MPRIKILNIWKTCVSVLAPSHLFFAVDLVTFSVPFKHLGLNCLHGFKQVIIKTNVQGTLVADEEGEIHEDALGGVQNPRLLPRLCHWYGLAVLYWVLHTCHKLQMRETVKDLVRNLGPGVEVMHITSVYIPYITQSYGFIRLQDGLGNVVAQYAQKEIGLDWKQNFCYT